jgi:hypothetical protein
MLWLSEKMNAHLLRYAKKVTRREGEGKEARTPVRRGAGYFHHRDLVSGLR